MKYSIPYSISLGIVVLLGASDKEPETPRRYPPPITISFAEALKMPARRADEPKTPEAPKTPGPERGSLKNPGDLKTVRFSKDIRAEEHSTRSGHSFWDYFSCFCKGRR